MGLCPQTYNKCHLRLHQIIKNRLLEPLKQQVVKCAMERKCHGKPRGVNMIPPVGYFSDDLQTAEQVESR